jgi:hypothetical protein
VFSCKIRQILIFDLGQTAERNHNNTSLFLFFIKTKHAKHAHALRTHFGALPLLGLMVRQLLLLVDRGLIRGRQQAGQEGGSSSIIIRQHAHTATPLASIC